MGRAHRDALYRRLPSEHELQQWPSGERRARVGVLLEETLAAFEDDERTPEGWESIDLKSAVAAYEGRSYSTTLFFVDRALHPPPDAGVAAATVAASPAALVDLRAQFERAKDAA